MSNSDNKNCHYIVLNSAKNPEITYPITPIFGEVSLQSFSKIPWISTDCNFLRHIAMYPGRNLSIQRLELFSRRTRILNCPSQGSSPFLQKK